MVPENLTIARKPSFKGVMHVDVTEGDVIHEAASDGANGHADTAGVDPFKQHVL